jgi:hypothetical protein
MRLTVETKTENGKALTAQEEAWVAALESTE